MTKITTMREELPVGQHTGETEDRCIEFCPRYFECATETKIRSTFYQTGVTREYYELDHCIYHLETTKSHHQIVEINIPELGLNGGTRPPASSKTGWTIYTSFCNTQVPENFVFCICAAAPFETAQHPTMYVSDASLHLGQVSLLSGKDGLLPLLLCCPKKLKALLLKIQQRT